MDLKDIRLVGVDLDGTLLDDNKCLPAETVEIIKSLYQRGIIVVPITGRPFKGLPACVTQIDEIEYAITSNGAQVFDLKNNKNLFSFQIPNKSVNNVLNQLKPLDCMFEVFADGVGYIEPNVYDFYVKEYTGTVIGEYIFSSRKTVDSISSIFCDDKKKADEIFVICKDAKSRNEIASSIVNIDSIQSCNLVEKYLEITKIGTDKGNALSELCKYLKIDLANTIAFGDGENDLQFMEKAGVAVAMQNACDEVKKRADIITKSNNENGVYEILKQI